MKGVIVMLESLIIVFREGLEAFLVVAIMLAYVTNTGRQNLKKPIFAGIAVALIISITTGWHIAELAEDPLWEGSLSLIAGALVASFTIYIMKTAKNIRGDIHKKIEAHAQKESLWAAIGVFVFTVLMIAREGMETALMLGAFTAQEETKAVLAGAAIGLLTVALIGYLWVTQSHKINLKLFLQVTGLFLIFFSIDLFIYGLHELSEMDALPFIGQDMNVNFHIATEFIETPIISSIITLSLILIPCIWLGFSYISGKLSSSQKTKSFSAAE